MSEENLQANQTETTADAGQPKNDKEYNFAQIRRQLEQEKQARLEALKQIEQLKAESAKKDIDDDDFDEPYIDRKYFKKTLQKEAERIAEEAERRAEKKLSDRLNQDRVNTWLRNNPDFEEVMQHAQKFAEHDPELAETILEMPEGFERQKLVYKNIKALGLHKPKEKESSIQEKINQNRRSPYYQPSHTASAPYGASGDFSAAGQKNAYQQMKELQKRLGGG